MFQNCQRKRQEKDEKMSEKKTVKKSKAWGLASTILGSCSIVLWFAPYFALPMSILAIVFASKQKKIAPSGLATAGIITGIIGIVINSVTMLFFLAMLMLGMI